MLSDTGGVIEGDKSISLQAQQVWAFAWLYNTLDGQPAWLEHAKHGGAFLNQFAHDDELTSYAQVDRRGRPVTASDSLVPDCTAVMAYTQLHRATGNDEWAMLAKQLVSSLFQRRNDSREQSGQLSAFRQTRHLSEPGILLKMMVDLHPLVDEETWKQHTDAILHELLNEFVDRRTNTLREYVLPEGSFYNTPEGRRINIGLTFQTASYLLDFYARQALLKPGPATSNFRKLPVQVAQWCLQLCEQGWDEATGGLSQLVDFKQQPLVFPDAQQKWNWVQLEALAALLKVYVYTRQTDCLKWFKRIHDYTFHHFPDPKQPGWYLAIDQYNQPILKVKSMPSVGCYSQIRCLAEITQLLPACGRLQPKERAMRTLP